MAWRRTVKAFSEDTTYTFKATQPGIHTYHLAVRDEEGQSLSTKYSISVIVPAEKKLHCDFKERYGGVSGRRNKCYIVRKLHGWI